MTSYLNYLKGVYQHAKAVGPESLAKLLASYDEKIAIEIAKSKLNDREITNNKSLNFIMAIPINNWEAELIRGVIPYGNYFHIPFEPKGFFANTTSWEEWRESNFVNLQSGFNMAYKQDDLNILFMYLSEFHINPKHLKSFRKKNVVIINFNWDDRLHYESQHRGQSVGIRKIAKEVDINLTLSASTLSRYQLDRSAAFYWDGYDSNKDVDIVLPNIETNKVLFFGSCYGYRETVVNYLIKKNTPIEVYGTGWGSKFISYENLAYKIPRYALNLGVSTIGYSNKLSCVKGRDIEVPSLGGLYATNYNKEITNVYISGKEILTYKSLDGCYRLCGQVLERPHAFSSVRYMGTYKAQKYSWEARFRYLISLVGYIVG